MTHRDVHPVDVADCWQCRMGVGRRSSVAATQRIRHGADPTRRHDVIRDDGPLRGTVGGWHTEHWDGRQDATVTPAAVRVRATTSEER